MDEDAKIRRDIYRFLKELQVEDIREFASSAEFDQAFFAELAKAPEGEKPQGSPLEHLHADVVKFLNGANFCQDAPAFDGTDLSLELNAADGLILKSSQTKIFGRIVTEILANSVKFESLVVPEMRSGWTELLDDLALETGGKHIVGIKNDKGQLWVLRISGTIAGRHIKMHVENVTVETMIALGKLPSDTKLPGEDQPAKKPIDIIIFRADVVLDKDIKKWVTRTAALMRKVNLWPEGNRPKFVVTRYEDDSREKANFNHPFVDDMLYLPLDRLVFLQKMELVDALPKKVSPTHLFVQAADEPVEMAKKVEIERINDLGIAISNPVALVPGTPGHFYFRFPGQKTLTEVWVKATHSVPHPDKEGHKLVYFGYFGLTKSTLREIRQFLARDVSFKPLINQDPAAFEYNPDNIFITDEQKLRKTVAVIDYDEATRKSAAETIRKEVGNMDVIAEDTFSGFFKRYLERAGEGRNSTASAPDDFYAEIISFVISPEKLRLELPLSVPNDTDKLLGWEAKKLYENPENWLKLFEDPETHEVLLECLQILQTTKRIQKDLELKTADGNLTFVNVEFVLEENMVSVRLNLKPVDSRTFKTIQAHRIESLEALVIDATLLTGEVAGIMKSVHDACLKAGIRTPTNGPHLIVTCAENQKIDFKKFLDSPAITLVYKPLETRRLLYFISYAASCPFTPYIFENLGWKEDRIAAKIARDATLVEVSEFGAMLRSSAPLKPGTMLYLFRSIYNSAPDSNLCVRVYHTEEDESAPGQYLSSVVYFGITDTFLKFTRSYIRESYAHKKAKDSQG